MRCAGCSENVNNSERSGSVPVFIFECGQVAANVPPEATRSAVGTLEGHSSSVSDVAVTPDGKQAVSASSDNTLKGWDLDSGTTLATFTCDGASYSCAFIDDHKLIAR